MKHHYIVHLSGRSRWFPQEHASMAYSYKSIDVIKFIASFEMTEETVSCECCYFMSTPCLGHCQGYSGGRLLFGQCIGVFNRQLSCRAVEEDTCVPEVLPLRLAQANVRQLFPTEGHREKLYLTYTDSTSTLKITIFRYFTYNYCPLVIAGD